MIKTNLCAIASYDWLSSIHKNCDLKEIKFEKVLTINAWTESISQILQVLTCLMLTNAFFARTAGINHVKRIKIYVLDSRLLAFSTNLYNDNFWTLVVSGFQKNIFWKQVFAII